MAMLVPTTVTTSITRFPEAGDYDIKFTFNAITGMSSASVIKQNVPTYDYTFYVLLRNGGTPYLYLWNGSNRPNGNWPGTQMTQTTSLADDNDWYTMTVTCEYATLSAIVDLGNGANQSANINDLAPGTYYITWDGGSGTTAIVSTDAPTAPVTPDYYVVGDNATLFPNGWDDDPTRMMTDNGDGTYSWTASNVSLTAGTTYSYKVHSSTGIWYPSGDNQTFDVAISGAYNVVFTFDGQNVTAVATLIQAADMGTYYITGSEGLGLDWSEHPTTEMTFDATTGIYSYSTAVEEEGDYYFVFANGQGSSWDEFNENYRIGPESGTQNIDIDGNWVTTQMAGGDGGSYKITIGAGPVTIYLNPSNMTFLVNAVVPTSDYTFYVLPSDGTTTPILYLWDSKNNPLIGGFPGTAITEQQPLDDGNTWHKWSGSFTVDMVNAIVSGGNSDSQTANIVNLTPNTYYIQWNPATREYSISTIPPTQGGSEYYLVGLFSQKSRYWDSEAGKYNYKYDYYDYQADQGLQFKYDGSNNVYYLNNIVLSNGAGFCLSTSLGSSADDWGNMGTRYGYGGDVITDGYHAVLATDVNTPMPISEWPAVNATDFRMSAAGVFNVLANPEEGWVKLIRTDSTTLTPMNIYLQQTPNVTLNPDYLDAGQGSYNYDGTPWPLAVFNKLVATSWEDGNRYGVTYVGDTTTVDGKTWWHWTVECSIGDVFFNRINKEPYSSETIWRKAGVLWVTWDEENGNSVMTDHTREYFEASAQDLPSNVTVVEGHYYVYFINTVGWDEVSVNAWGAASPYTDAYGNDVQNWPGQAMECVGIDPVTGYEVWRYDFGPINATTPPTGILFNDSDPNPNNEYKEQTGDFEFINGGVYDYLGLFDGSYTLNNIIRTAAENVRYTISNDLVGVYYDKDAVTVIPFTDANGQPDSETVIGALYAKDLNLYGEKSHMPDSTYTDYVYDICASTHTDGGSQIMDKKTSYDQSNWIKLVYSPNYDNRNHTPLPKGERPDLSKFVNHVIPGGTLDLFLTDSVNPTGHIMAISLGEQLNYEPNVYVSANFNDTIVYTYAHNEWMPRDAEYTGTYRTRPYVEWITDPVTGEVIRGEVKRRVRVEEAPYKMYYVAPKPQEVAYVTWIVYDNLNIEENGIRPYGDYTSPWDPETPGDYWPYTSSARTLPVDPGRFYAPMNWDRSQVIPGDMYNTLAYLSEDQLDDVLGGYGQEYGPYSNGYMQYGGIKVNWSLFDTETVGMPWYQVFQPGQAYKVKAIIRYARGNDEGYLPNECYGPSNGGEGSDHHVLNAPRRIGGNDQGGYANMYFTGNYQGLDDSKFIIFPIEASPNPSNGDPMGNVTSVKEVNTSRSVVAVTYYNLMGIESSKPFDGLNIVVTTYSDGSRTSRKIMR